MSDDEAERVFEKMVFFGSYGFNKSHSVAYSMLAYWTMYLKVYYPIEFYCALINYSNAAKRHEYVLDARKNDVKILLPDVNFSEKRWVIEGDCLRAGLEAVVSISEKASTEIMKAREDGKFGTLEDFLSRVVRRVVNKRVVGNLGKSAALRSLGVGVQSSVDVDEMLKGNFEEDEDEQSESVIRIISDVVDFPPSDDPVYRISAMASLLRSKVKFSKVQDVLEHKLSPGEYNFLGHVDKVKFGYRDIITKSAVSKGFADDLGGAYSNFSDGDYSIQITFQNSIMRSEGYLKKRIEVAEDVHVLIRATLGSLRGGRQIKLIVSKVLFLDDLIHDVDLDAFQGGIKLGGLVDTIPGNDLLSCKLCSLRGGCKAPVRPSVGKYNVMAVAEAPGGEEDDVGAGLVGRAGRYLWAVLGRFNIYREHLIVNNVVKCRPPNNKLPNIGYAKRCGKEWLESEIEVLKPVVIFAMGSTVSDFFCGEKITNLQSKIFWNSRYKCWMVYGVHPAAVLHDASRKKDFEDSARVFSQLIRKVF
jgi:uracil-DNA glycosylase family 4